MSRTPILILALAIVLGTGFAALLLGTGDPDVSGPVVAWTAADEEALPEEEAPDPEAGALGEEEISAERTALDPARTPSGPEAPPPDVELRGRVVDAGGRPVAGARVTLELRRFDRRRVRGRPGRARVRRPVVTQDDGVFAFHGAGARRMTVTLLIVHETYAPAVVSRTFQNAEGVVELGDVVVTEGGALLGSVIDETGAGVPGATVEIVPMGDHPLARRPDRKALLPPVRVGPTGGFLVARLAPGDYRVRATAPQRLESWSPTVTVQEGRSTELEPLRLQPGCVLYGTVLTPDGRPVPGADVHVSVPGLRFGVRRDRTKPDGAFTVDHLPRSPLTVTVRKRGRVTVRLEGVDAGTASPLVVRLPEGLRIEGVVTDARTGKPVTRYAIRAVKVGNLPEDGPTRAERLRKLEAELRAIRSRLQAARRTPQDGAEQGRARSAAARQELAKLRAAERSLRQRYQREASRTERLSRDGGRPRVWRTRSFHRLGPVGKAEPHPDGRFELTGLDRGIWAVEVSSPEHPRQRSESVELRPGQPPARMVLRLQRGLAVRGVVRSAGGRPLGDARVELLEVVEEDAAAAPRGGPVLRLLDSMVPSGPRGITVLSARSAPDGTFVLRPVAAGRYMVTARGKNHGTATTPPFVVGSDVAGVELELPALATLRGRVRSVPPDLRGEVRVVAFGGVRRRTHIVDIELDGRYELDDLEPGPYLVRAVAGDLRQFFFSQVRQLDASGGLGFDVTLAPGEVRELDLTAQVFRTSEVFGVVTRNGSPAPGLRVRLENEPPPGATRRVVLRLWQARTDGSGAYQLRNVAAGRYRLRVVTPGRRPRTLHEEILHVTAGTKQRHDIAMVTAVLEGRVRSDDGTPPDQLDGVVRLYAGASARPADERAFRQAGGRVFTARVRDGAFLFEDLPVGPHVLVLALRGREERTRRFTATPGKQVVEWTAPRGRTAPRKPKGGPPGPGGKGKTAGAGAKQGR